MPLRSRVGFVVYATLFGLPAIVVAAVTLLRAPKSLAVLALLILSGIAVLWHVSVWRRNTGTIMVTDDELIVRPQTGPTLRRSLTNIRSVSRSGVHKRTRYAQYFDTYVRIVSDGEIPLQFRWHIGTSPKTKDHNPAQFLISTLKRRLPELAVTESAAVPEKLRVEHGRRSDSRFGSVGPLMAMAICLFAGVLTYLAIPRSYGSAADALRRVERSFGPSNELSSLPPLPIEVRSEPCFGQQGGSYWEEGVFNVEIRKLEGTFAVMADESTAQTRAKDLAPKDWMAYATEIRLNEKGNASVNFTTPCYRANRGEFVRSVEAQYSVLLARFRATIDQQ
jgi:hypothetical protein